jgi:16S rRNA (guanine966-N2)-methyltransferase
MRITGGTLVGRTFESPLTETTRPMRDRVRQALFNILNHHDWGKDIGNVFAGTEILDAFCGTGALAFEALSWGAKHATLLDKDRIALEVATKNAHTLGLKDKCHIMLADTLKPPKANKPCQLVFLAPPYRMGLIPPAMVALNNADWLAKHVLIVAETAKNEPLELPEGFTTLFARGYGETVLGFISR